MFYHLLQKIAFHRVQQNVVFLPAVFLSAWSFMGKPFGLDHGMYILIIASLSDLNLRPGFFYVMEFPNTYRIWFPPKGFPQETLLLRFSNEFFWCL